MSSSSIHALRELARQDEALRLALGGAQQAAELQSIAAGQGIELSEAEAQAWLVEQDSAANLDADVLEALTEGLMAPDQDQLSDAQLAGIAGGLGDPYPGEAGAGEA